MKAALQCRNFVSWLPSILFVSWVVYEQGLLSPYLKLLKGFRSLLNFTYKGSLLLWYFHIYNASWAWWQLLEMKHPVLSSVVPFVGLCFHFFPFSASPSQSRTRGFMTAASFNLWVSLWVSSFFNRYLSKTRCRERAKRMGDYQRSPQGEWAPKS